VNLPQLVDLPEQKHMQKLHPIPNHHLGWWLAKPNSSCFSFTPNISFPQTPLTTKEPN
jgi:hypothetical protein